MRFRQALARVGVGLFVFSLLFGIFIFSNWVRLNFHPVIPHAVYRSRQLQAPELKKLAARYHFRSILNLRGIHPDAPWYQAEIKFTTQRHLAHYNLALPAHALPSWANLALLVTTLVDAPKPLLIHCREGADRTGLAAAISLILTGATARAVKRQLSWRYNVLSSHTIGYQVFQNYFVWIHTQHLPYGRDSFLQWVHTKPTLHPYLGWYV